MKAILFAVFFVGATCIGCGTTGSSSSDYQELKQMRQERLIHEERTRINREAIQRRDIVERAIIRESLR